MFRAYPHIYTIGIREHINEDEYFYVGVRGLLSTIKIKINDSSASASRIFTRLGFYFSSPFSLRTRAYCSFSIFLERGSEKEEYNELMTT